MKLTVKSLTIYEDAPDGTQSVGAQVDLRCDIPDGQAGGSFGITFKCEGARDMPFGQLEKLVLERVEAELK
ncbi:hypothetical protein NP534_02880 [Pseudomonas sp. 39004]|uniref:hypothetical protein n=1 Tax=Pseudomonas sp. 39004 TaxID=2967213 RepID=UPI002363ACF8|nr:hypothetical protein [Pseudomonas sp. 39004]MDD1959040.1 hypothetical protein [Pseudomonas sp. 39004]